MMEKLKARRAEIARLREERGATDPILIIAGIAITLILLVGGSFAISGFISNAHNLNAKGDLDRIATAQSAYLALNDGYGALSVGPNVASQNTQLQNGAIGFTPTAGNSTIVRSAPGGWTAVTKSGSGAVFLRSSESGESFEVGGGMVTDPAGYSAWTPSRTNLMTNPLGAGATAGTGYTGQNGGATAVFDSASHGVLVTSPAGTLTNVGVNMAGAVSYTPKVATYTVSADITGVTAGGWRLAASSSWVTAATYSSFVSIAPGETKRVSLTFTTNGSARGALSLWRQSSGVDSQVVVSNVILEETGTAGSFFDGSTAGTELTQTRWSGAVNSSTSILDTRTIAAGTGQVWSPGTQPSGFVLPPGISWSQVAADLQDIYS